MQTDHREILDARDDPGGIELHRIRVALRVPGLDKAAAAVAAAAPAPPPAIRQYADPFARRWPLHDKDAVVTSAAYFYDTRPGLDARRAARAEARLRAAARHRGVLPEVEAIAKAAEAARAPAPPPRPEDHLYRGPEGDRLPVRSADEARTAAAWFAAHGDALAYRARAGVARRLLAKAAALGAALDDDLVDRLEQSAGLGPAPGRAVADLLASRARRLDARPHPGARAAAARLRAKAAEAAADPDAYRPAAVRGRIAEAIDGLDRAFGLGPYGPGLPRPEDALFPLRPTAVKRAREAVVTTASGAVYARAELDRLPRHRVRAALGHAALEAAGSGPGLDGAKLAAALDDAGARRLDALAEASGVRPLARRPRPIGPDAAARRRMAALLDA